MRVESASSGRVQVSAQAAMRMRNPGSSQGTCAASAASIGAWCAGWPARSASRARAACTGSSISATSASRRSIGIAAPRAIVSSHPASVDCGPARAAASAASGSLSASHSARFGDSYQGASASTSARPRQRAQQRLHRGLQPVGIADAPGTAQQFARDLRPPDSGCARQQTDEPRAALLGGQCAGQPQCRFALARTVVERLQRPQRDQRLAGFDPGMQRARLSVAAAGRR